jgi:hypothetical protein
MSCIAILTSVSIATGPPSQKASFSPQEIASGKTLSREYLFDFFAETYVKCKCLAFLKSGLDELMAMQTSKTQRLKESLKGAGAWSLAILRPVGTPRN